MKTLVFAFIFMASGASVYAQRDASSGDSISKVYSLGEISVMGVHTKKSLTDKVTALQMRQFGRTNATEALNLLPGLSITEAGARNEGQIYLRGFNLLQTPVFYDGIPIYVPYDGNVDISRFTTFDLSQISVSKALTSVLYGPNTMGGAINLVSRNPAKRLEVNGLSGVKFSEKGLNGYHASVNVGSRMEKFYLLGSFSYLDNQFTSLSGKFSPGTNEDGGRRENSQTKDLKFSAKAGYTPNATDEYSVNFIIQDASKGIPPGVEGNQFRSYPDYNKKSVYYKSSTQLGGETSMAVTAFYDNYYNIMCQYDDNQYLLQNRNNAFRSVYDDYSAGGSVNLSSAYFSNNRLKLALYEKYDSHKEYNAAIPANEATGQKEKTGEPVQEYLDNTFSAGLEDVYTINPYVDVIAGINYSYRKNIQAQEYGTHYETGEKNVLFDFPAGSDNAFNYQLAVIVTLAEHQEISFSASRKSRFASQKERYSSRFGSALPNPDLQSEFSWIFDLSYKGEIQSVFQYELSLFRNNIDDAIYQVTIPGAFQSDGVTPMYQNRNVGKSYATGYEVSLGAKPLAGITLGGNYTYIYRKNREDPGLKFTDVPAHKGVVYGKFSLPAYPATYLHVDMEANSKRYYTSDGQTLPGYALVNAKVFSQIVRGVSLEAGVRNLFDRNYFLSYNYPREGRTFFTSVVYDF
jgi:iron complex outermembrane receptor protein